MALNFPSSPTLNQIYTFGSASYQFDGTRWKSYSVEYNYQGAAVTISNSYAVVDLSQGNLFDLNISDTIISGSLKVQFANNTTAAQTFKIKVKNDPSFSSAYNIQNASYDNLSFSVATQSTLPVSVFFKPDGTKMFVADVINSRVLQYTLSTPWSVNTAAYDDVSFSTLAQDAASPYGLFFKSDGTKMYVTGINNDSVYQYTLSTPWNLNTASYDSISFSVALQESIPLSVSFKPDGTKMYVIGNATATVYQDTLSTPWDISTASYDNINFNVSAQSAAFSLTFTPDGSTMYLLRDAAATVYQYTLLTPWEVNTASYNNINLNVSAQESTPAGLFFKSDGTKLFIIGYASDTIYQYSLQDSLSIQWPTNVSWEDILTTPSPPADGQSKVFIFTTSDAGNKYFGKLYE